jgi:predicted transcriptional regulator of viral defense system
MPQHTEEEAILSLLRKFGAVRGRDIQEHGFSRQALKRLHDRGAVDRPSRGLYVLPDADFTEHHGLAEAAKLIPHGVVCLLSALRFHGLTTQEPFEIWLAVGNKAWKPDVTWPPIRIVRFSGPTLSCCVQEHVVEGVTVRIYSPAKTVADCFKFRNKIGLDVAMEALRDCWQQKKMTMDELWEVARACRVSNVMRPYVESLP